MSAATLPTPRTEAERLKLKVKVATCPTCRGWLTQSAFPYCESSKESIKNFRAHAEAGDNINVMTVARGMKLTYCKCDRKRPARRKSAPLLA